MFGQRKQLLPIHLDFNGTLLLNFERETRHSSPRVYMCCALRIFEIYEAHTTVCAGSRVETCCPITMRAAVCAHTSVGNSYRNGALPIYIQVYCLEWTGLSSVRERERVLTIVIGVVQCKCIF